jgi:uncharacterized protein (DUF58 family)
MRSPITAPGPVRALRRRELVRMWVPYIRGVRTPLGCLGLTGVASGLCGLFLHPQGFSVSITLFLITGCGIVWPWIIVRGLSGTISFDRLRCREGDEVGIRLTVRNRLPIAAWGVSVDEGCAGQSRTDTSGERLCALIQVPGWRRTEMSVAFTPRCRGEYPRTAPRIASGFPFGLWTPSRPLSAERPLVVWPKIFAVGPMPEAAGGVAHDGLAVRDRAGNWGDPLGVRPYRRGDPLRRVHWGQTAKHRQLIVCEVQSHAVPRAQIVLDVAPTVHSGSGPDGSLEWSIRIAASFADAWISRGAQVELLAPGAILPPRHKSRRVHADQVADALARLKPATEQDFEALCRSGDSSRSNAMVRIIITTDRRLNESPPALFARPGARLVVLKCDGFEHRAAVVNRAALTCKPWIMIDGPPSVPSQLLRAGKEVLLGT